MNRDTLIKGVTFIGGIYFAARFFLPAVIGGEPPLHEFHESILTGLTAVGAAAVGLGVISLLLIHGKKIAYLKSGWGSSAVLLFGLFAMLGAGIGEWVDASIRNAPAKRLFVLRDFTQELEKRRTNGIDIANSVEALNKELQAITLQDGSHINVATQDLAAIRVTLGEIAATELEKSSSDHENSLSNQLFSFLYDGIFVSLGAAMFSLLGCYIASAAFRAFRIRSFESALMMVAALLVILGQIPWGQSWWSGFPVIRMWLLNVPSSAAFRAIEVGSAVAGIVLSWRIWLGFDIGKKH
jgi:hypothetical protein